MNLFYMQLSIQIKNISPENLEHLFPDITLFFHDINHFFNRFSR